MYLRSQLLVYQDCTVVCLKESGLYSNYYQAVLKLAGERGGFDSKEDRVYRSGGCYLRNHLMLIYLDSLTQKSCYLKYFLGIF